MPDPAQHNPTPKKVAELVARIDKPLAWISRRSGISYNRVRMLVAGHRDLEDGRRVAVLLKYPEQYTLEAIAHAVETARAVGQ